MIRPLSRSLYFIIYYTRILNYSTWSDIVNIYGFNKENRWLSNFAKLDYPIFYKGLQCNTTEEWYVLHKCKNFDDAKYIAEFQSPAKAKELGKLVELSDDFESNRIAIMKNAISQKFNMPSFYDKLIQTEGYIEETNTWHDNFFGNCICEKCQNIEGENILGKLIMEFRASNR